MLCTVGTQLPCGSRSRLFYGGCPRSYRNSGVVLNFQGVYPMKALVWSGQVRVSRAQATPSDHAHHDNRRPIGD